MKLDFISDGSPDAPLVRLHSFTSDEARQLHAVSSRLADVSVTSVELQTLDFVDGPEGMRLVLFVDSDDLGVFMAEDSLTFICGLTRGTWTDVCDRIEPFTRGGLTALRGWTSIICRCCCRLMECGSGCDYHRISIEITRRLPPVADHGRLQEIRSPR